MLMWTDGTSYEGDFMAGSIDGSGMMKWPSGDMYQGGFMGGAPNGEGVYVWATGSRFEGMYENGLPKEGTFYVTDSDGRDWHFMASQDADGAWMVQHPDSQM